MNAIFRCGEISASVGGSESAANTKKVAKLLTFMASLISRHHGAALGHSRSTKFPSVQHDKLRPTSIFVRRPSCLELTARTFATNHINRTFQTLSKNVLIGADIAISALETFHVKWAI